MMDEMANHATRVRRYIDRYGFDEVERFIDICLCLEDLIDPYSPFMPVITECAPRISPAWAIFRMKVLPSLLVASIFTRP